MSQISQRSKKVLLLAIIMCAFIYLISFNVNIPNSPIINNEDCKPTQEDYINTQALSSDNIFTGVGAPWNVSHYANNTDTGVASFINNSYQLVGAQSGFGWTGYKLDAEISDLYDERQWINGTMTYGPDDDDYSANSDDSIQIQDWDFFASAGGDNDVSGNYMDSAAPNSGGQDCLELRLDGRFSAPANRIYEQNDGCRWEYSTPIPRGNVIDSTLSLDLRPVHLSLVNSWAVYISINNVEIAKKDIVSLNDIGIGNWGTFILPQQGWANTSNVFTGPLHLEDTEIDIELRHGTSTVIYGPEDGANIDYQQVLVDNVEFYVTAEVLPTQVNLEMNETAVTNIDYGSGTVEVTGNWNGTENPLVYANFSSAGQGAYAGGYNLDLDAELNLFAIKQDQPTTYETDAASLGTSFTVSNNSIVDWEAYAGIAVPTGYEEVTMRIEYPTDVNITWISSATQPSTNVLDQCDNSTAGILIIPVTTIVSGSTANGFWKLLAKSNNYLEQLDIYNNASGSWILSNEFKSGEYINITAKITDTAQISGYIQQTKAYLNIRFPNGTLWQDKIQSKFPDANGYLYFDVFQIPATPPNYEIGEYEVIITWNNSHSVYGLNESGIMYNMFNVIHYSTLTPDQTYYSKVAEDSKINIKVSFNDLENNDAIEGAQVYLYNFTNPTVKQFFSELSPGYYLLELNVSGANAGDNNITIYANSTSYENTQKNITISIIKSTNLVADQTILSVPWNQNFVIQFNYTEKKSGLGIDTIPSSNWLGFSFTESTMQGVYNLTCNTSLTQINQQYSLIIQASKFGYESQSILIKVGITERETILEDVNLNQTLQDQIEYTYGEVLNITVKYTDIGTGSLINTNNVELQKEETLIGTFELNPGGFYNYSLNTSALDLGVNVLTIYANKDNYSAAFTSITVTVNERDTYLEILINDISTSVFTIYNTSIGDTLNITVWYRDYFSINDPNINSAVVQLIGVGNPKAIVKNPLYNQFNITVLADDMGEGVSIITVSAQEVGYNSISENIVIYVSERKTNLTLYINGSYVAEGGSYDAEIGDYINITVTYNDFLPPYDYIDEASIDLLGIGSLTNQTTLKQYNITVKADKLDPGANILTIFAQKADYQPQTLYFLINLIDKNTSIQLFLNGTDRTIEESIEAYMGDYVNVTIKYTDKLSNFIEDATVEIRGEGLVPTNLTQNLGLEHYNITLSTNNLNPGLNILTLFADKDKYEQRTIKISIIIVDKPTAVQIFLDGKDITSSKSYEVPLGAKVNVTLRYLDNLTKTHLAEATVELRDGGTFIGLLTDDGQQYTRIIDTGELFDIDLKILTIIAQKGNYTSQSPNIRLNIRRIIGEIDTEDGESSYNIKPGESITFKIIINNKDFGGRIKEDTIVKYTSELGQGEVKDSNSEGVFEITLESVPEGTYTITITVYAGDDYNIDSFKITLNVFTPEEEARMYQTLTVISAAAAIAVGGYLYAYQKVLKYPKPVRKVRKFRKTIKKKKAPELDVDSRETAFRALYMTELAKTSKFLKVKPPETKTIPEDKLKKFPKQEDIKPEAKKPEKPKKKEKKKEPKKEISPENLQKIQNIEKQIISVEMEIKNLTIDFNAGKIPQDDFIKKRNFLKQKIDTFNRQLEQLKK